jgi:molybdopterin adenylyltransferase
MSVAEHHALSPTRVSCFVISTSDSRSLEQDTGGQSIVRLLEDAGHTVAGRRLLRDEPSEVSALVREVVERGEARVIITTGGTGIARRDSTYEALTTMFDKTLVGFGELFRMLSFQEIGPAAMLSRATAGVTGGCAVFVLPGSPNAVRLAMTRLILPELGHIVRELTR